MAEYMDSIYNNHLHWLKLNMKNPPSFYMDQNVYGSFIRHPVGIRNRDLPGGRNIMWSTDYPHSECTWPDSCAIMADHFAGVPDSEREPIVHGNALRFYGLSA